MPLPANHVYKASLDRFAYYVTWFVGLLFGIQALGTIVLVVNGTPTENEVLMGIFVPVGLGGCFYLLYMYRVLRYELLSDGIRICRPLQTRKILFQEITEVLKVDDESMKWTLRLFANGGVFGYFGFFTNHKYGRMSWYASRRKSLLMLKLKTGERVVITPDDMSIAEQIQSRIPLTDNPR